MSNFVSYDNAEDLMTGIGNKLKVSEIEWSVWNAMTDAEKETYCAAHPKFNILNPPEGGSGGHVIEDASGTDMTQREGLQFVGVYTEDDSTNDRTKVNIVREMTKEQMDALTSAQKKGFIRTTDEPDNPIVDSKVTFDLTATSGNTYSTTYSNCYKVGNHVYIRAYVTGNIVNTVTFATIPSQFMPQAKEICGTATVISSSAQTHGIVAINKSDNGLRVVETVPITGTAVFVMADYEL